MWIFEAILFIYLSAACTAQDSQNDPPVPVVKLQSKWSETFPSEKVVLMCEIHDKLNWTITWYKDEKEVKEVNSIGFFSGDRFLLTMNKPESGKYSCKGIHKSNSISTQASNSVQITVHANKPTPALSHNPISQNLFVGESVTFKCSIDVSSSWTYFWFLNGREVHHSEQDVYTIEPLNHINSGQYTCKIKRDSGPMGTQSNEVTLEVVDAPVPTVKLLNRWPEVFVSEVLSLGCESVSTDWSFTWFSNGKQLQVGPTVNINEQGAQLQISSASISDQGLYTCKAQHKNKPVSSGQSQPLNIRILDVPKPTVTKNPPDNLMYVGEMVNFTCDIFISSGWTFKWYKDDKEISGTGSTISVLLGLSDKGGYHCKAFRGSQIISSDKLTQHVYVVPVPSVRLLSRWSDVFVNEGVKLGCEAGSTDWSFTWERNGEPLSEDGILKTNNYGGELVISSASKDHAGAYSCKSHHKTRAISSGQSKPLSLTVYANTPKPTMTKVPTDNTMYVGETVTFACKVNVASGWKLKWFKDGSEIYDNNSTISITLGLSNGGQYFCKATRGETTTTTTESSDKITQTVLEIPVPSVKHQTEWLDVFPTENVKLGCGMTSGPSDWTYEWLKDQETLRDGNSLTFDSDKTNLTISSASALHKGQYKCKGSLKRRQVTSEFSTGLTLTVYDQKPRPVLRQDPEYFIMFNGEQVSFKCHIDISNGWEFEWYKDKGNDQLTGNINLNNYSVSSLDSANSGSYTCKARRGSFITDNSQAKELKIQAKPEPVISQKPDFQKVYTGETVIFTCEVKISSDWEYLWYKDGNPVNVSHSYSVTSATPSDVHSYKCQARRTKTRFLTEESKEKVIRVSEIPIPSVKNLTKWLDVFPTETVKLGCGMETGASDWLYNWQKDGQPIQNDKSLSLGKDNSTLTIHSSASHVGEYRCMGKLKDRSVQSNFSSGLGLKVYGAKPSIILEQYPEYNVSYTWDIMSFSCGVNLSTGWEYQWFKDNNLVATGHNYTIDSVQTSNTGKYKCQAKRQTFLTDYSRSVKIEVHERPAVDIILLTDWSEVFSTDSLVLKCEVKDNEDEWEYKWFKGEQEINQSVSEKHTVTPQNDPDQSQYMCQGIRSGRPSYTRRSDPFKTNNLLLKRRVLLSISGCLLFGICAVFLGCIVLRVLRKPVVDQEKPEETNLFLTMAELKERGDAPCPMVEYVTDEDVKKLAKDLPTKEDENGTICSEATPLPIASKEDEAAPSEGNNATENGGMVSFKQ